MSTPMSEPKAAARTASRSGRFAIGRPALSLPERSIAGMDVTERPFSRAICGSGRAAGALVLDLVVDLVDGVLGALDGDLAAQLGRDFLERLHALRLDMRDPDEDRAEPALHRAAHGARREREGGLGDGRVDHLGLREGAELEVLLGDVLLRRHGLEAGALLDAAEGGLGLARGREDDLLDGAALGRAEAGLDALIALAGVIVRHRVGLREGLGGDRDDVDGPVLGRAESRLALVVEGLELLVARRRDLAGGGRRQDEIGGGAPLGAVAVDRLAGGDRDLHRAGERVGELGAHEGAVMLAHEAGLRQPALAEDRGRTAAVELAARALEARLLGDAADDELIRHPQPELARLLVERRLGHHPRQDLAVEAHGAGLLRRHRLTGAPDELLQLGLVVGAELVAGDLDVADPRHDDALAAAEDVVDAPDREADDQEAEQHGDDGLAEPGLAGGPQPLHHGGRDVLPQATR